MTTIDTLTLGDYRTNCYIVRAQGAQACLLIDPGYEPRTILARVRELGLTVEAIALTHGHFDHVGGVREIAAQTGCPVWVHEADCTMRRSPLTGRLFPLTKAADLPLSFYKEGDALRAAGLELTVLETPGHTRGSVCLLCTDALFTGDTLFHNTCGRTDLPGGSRAAMRASLARLHTLAYCGAFYPGHGHGGDFALEKRENPVLRGEA